MSEQHATELDTRTERLELRRPTQADIPQLHAIFSDPRLWAHYPTLRHTDLAQTTATVRQWLHGWTRDELGYWIIRLPGDDAVIGYGGCGIRHDIVWNLGYRLAPAAHGQGYATEVAREAIRHAHAARPDLPVTAYLVQHNHASAAVARRVGLTLAYRGPDAGNPDPAAVREVYSDRPLTPDQLATNLR